MGFDSSWWLVDSRNLKEDYPEIGTFGDWISVVRDAGSASVMRVILPDRNDIGFWLAMKKWRSSSETLSEILDAAKRDNAILQLKSDGIVQPGWKYTHHRQNALRNAVHSVVNSYAADQERKQVLKSLKIRSAGWNPSYLLIGVRKTEVLPLLVSLALREYRTNPDIRQMFLETMNEETAEEFLLAVSSIPLRKRSILVLHTV